MITSTDFAHCSIAMSGQDILGTLLINLFEMNLLNSSHQMVLPTIRKKVKPPYAIWWPSLMTDVGPIKKRSRCIDVRHVNGYLIIPGKVYLLNTKLQKYVLNEKIGRESRNESN
jgi:hypothetical protein